MNNPIIMEQIAMYMVSLPCPPLPVSLNVTTMLKTSNETEENIQVCTTHDLLAGLIVCAMDRKNTKLNNLRKTKQLAITKTFLTTLDKLDEQDTSGMYNACQVFTNEYIMSFDDPSMPAPAVRLLPMDYVENNDKVHKACCSWNAAQDIMHAGTEKRNAAQFSLLSYKDLIKVHCSRVKAQRPVSGVEYQEEQLLEAQESTPTMKASVVEIEEVTESFQATKVVEEDHIFTEPLAVCL
jgi:hypothetical protein